MSYRTDAQASPTTVSVVASARQEPVLSDVRYQVAVSSLSTTVRVLNNER